VSVNTYLTSIARLIKARTLSRSLLDELLGSPTWKESADILKERGIIPEVGQTIEETESIVKRHYTSLARQVREFTLSSNVGKRIADLYYYRLTVDDLKYLVAMAQNKLKPERKMVKSEDQILSSAADSSPGSIEELLPLLRGTVYGEALEYALRIGQKELSAINSTLDFFFIDRISSLVNEMRGDWKSKADQLLCGYKDYYGLSAAATQHTLLSDAVCCKVTNEMLKDLAGSATFRDAAETLRRTEYGKGLGDAGLADILEAIERQAKVQARKAAKAIFMGDPFTPLSVMAALELLYLDESDIVKLINAQALRTPVARIKEILSFEFV